MSKKETREIELFLVDVLTSMQQIKKYTKDFKNADDFLHSEIYWDATIRQLEIIGEALNNLLEDNNFNSLAPTYFRKIVNFRNAISHGYFGIDPDEVWDIIQTKLDILENDLILIIKNHIDIKYAIEVEIIKYKKLNYSHLVHYLTSFYDEI